MDKVIPISSIIVPTRARVDYGDIPDLAKKIKSTKGLRFNKVTVEEIKLHDETPNRHAVFEYHLLAGGRRLEAYKLLASGNKSLWPEEDKPTQKDFNHYLEVPCTVLKDLTLEDRLRIELVENLGRKDFDWQEACGLVTRYHQAKQAFYGTAPGGRGGKKGWGVRDTASDLGLNPADVVHYLKLDEGLGTDPDLQKITSKSKAITKLKRNNQQMIADLLNITDYDVDDIQIVCGDSKEVLPPLPDESIDMVITDPPWGIDFEESLSTHRLESIDKHYDTDYDIADTLDVLINCYQKLKPNSPIYMFYSAFPEKVLEAQKLLGLSGFNFERIPIIWYKKHVLAHNSNEVKHGYNYEIMIYGWKGERPFFNKTSRNVFESQVAYLSRIHASEKPEALLTELLLLHTKEGDLILDPFGGSCKLADACKSNKRRCLVVEKEDGLVKMATLRVRGI